MACVPPTPVTTHTLRAAFQTDQVPSEVSYQGRLVLGGGVALAKYISGVSAAGLTAVQRLRSTENRHILPFGAVHGDEV